MLKIRDIHVYYGAIHAIKGISFEVNEGELVTLIGANGAGKSTILKAVSGLLRPRSGEIEFMGRPIAHAEPHAIMRMGLSHVPEGRRVFQSLSVEENLEMGAYTRSPEERRESMEEVFAQFPRLRERRRQIAGTLSGGEQQMLAIGRALMGKPKLIMLDEPSMGLAPMLVNQIFEIIGTMNRRGVTILLVEQNARMALQLADRGYVLETGRVVAADSAENLLENDAVRKAYLGG